MSSQSAGFWTSSLLLWEAALSMADALDNTSNYNHSHKVYIFWLLCARYSTEHVTWSIAFNLILLTETIMVPILCMRKHELYKSNNFPKMIVLGRIKMEIKA